MTATLVDSLCLNSFVYDFSSYLLSDLLQLATMRII